MKFAQSLLIISLAASLTASLGACSGATTDDAADNSGADAGTDTALEDTSVGEDAASEEDSGTTATGGVVINEVTSDGDDNIELVNTSEADLDISEWYVVDDAYDADTGEPADHRYAFESGTTLAAGEYVVLIKDTDHSFGVGKQDAIRLFDADDQLVDETSWPDLSAETSWCRIPDGVGDFGECANASFGESND